MIELARSTGFQVNESEEGESVKRLFQVLPRAFPVNPLRLPASPLAENAK